MINTYRPVMLRSDIETLVEMMATEGGKAPSPADALSILLQRLQGGEDVPAPTPKPVESHEATEPPALGRALEWFTARVDTLEEEIESLQARLVEKSADIDALRQEREAAVVAPSPATPKGIANPQSVSKVDTVIDALVSWNTAQDSPERQLRISIPVVKSLGLLVGASYQAAVLESLKAREAELSEHHSRLMLGQRHNRNVEDRDDVLQSIARDYLGVENWQDAVYKG